ncbi:CBS domain-containing protein [candidate division KSB1 bacterium]|nr:CBS domain-containing protein [candidate division KSB1 bacterium]
MKDITVSPKITIRQAMKTLNKTAEKCLIVVDINQKLLGTLTDGDIRRSILAGIGFTTTIENSYYKEPTILKEDEYTRNDAIDLLRSKKLDLIPVIDENNYVVDYVTWGSFGVTSDKGKNSLSNVSVVIMAGGKGTRLEPFTKVLPKPLVPINEKPIIEHIIENFTSMGVIDFYLTVNYKGRILKAYFEELQPNYKVNFIDEQEPLGTAGSLKFLDGKFNTPFFVTNCDIIIKADYTNIYNFHIKNEYDITLVASTREYIIPYGTCELNSDGYLSHINEKPQYDFLINTGLYILNPDVLTIIPENKIYHITHLIEDVKNLGKKVGVFPIDDDAWIDVGQWSEYKSVINRL